LETRQADPQSIWNTYSALIRMRQSMPALSGGDVFFVQVDNPAVFSVLRVSRDQALLLVANLGLEDLTGVGLTIENGPLIGRYRLTPIYGEAQASQLIASSQGGFTLLDSIRGIGALQSVIFLLEPF
jgi:hypothetical protein